MNYKIRVNSEVERREVQGLLEKIGGIPCSGLVNSPRINFIFIDGGFITGCKLSSNFDKSKCKEVNIAELRDLVVLNRNDRNDRNVADLEYPHSYLYLDSRGELFVFNIPAQRWRKSNLNGDQKAIARLKPIEKTEMKEYLKKIGNNEYMLVDGAGYSGQDNWIEVPEGATSYAKDSMFGDGFVAFFKEGAVFLQGMWMRCGFNHADGDVLWQRKETLNDQVASAEVARQPDKVLKEILEGNLPEFELNVEQGNVNQPIHYCSHPSGIECIEITRHHDFAIGNAIKYLWRAGLKDSSSEIQDLEKSIWYIQDKINQLKKQNENSCKD